MNHNFDLENALNDLCDKKGRERIWRGLKVKSPFSLHNTHKVCQQNKSLNVCIACLKINILQPYPDYFYIAIHFIHI